jgi:hypothetical protein
VIAHRCSTPIAQPRHPIAARPSLDWREPPPGCFASYESGSDDTVDRSAWSYRVEVLTAEIETRARGWLAMSVNSAAANAKL